MKLLAFAASHREESSNRKLLLLAAKHASALGVQVDIADYADMDMPIFNDTQSSTLPAATSLLAKRLEDVSGVIIAMPEYNWSFPGSLKNIIDWLSVIKPNPLMGKTALLMCATPGARGGVVGLQQLKTPLEALGVHVYNRAFPLAFAHSAITEAGMLRDNDQQDALTSIVNSYLQYTAKL